MKRLIESLARHEQGLLEARFLAPRVHGGKVRTRVQGLLYTFEPTPAEFEGWGLFTALSPSQACLDSEASLPLRTRYLQMLKPLRVHLVQPLGGQSWLAVPTHWENTRRVLGHTGPVRVHLVAQGQAFQQVQCRWDGSNLWYETVDRRADPSWPGKLARALREGVEPDRLEMKGCTPELRAAYGMLLNRSQEREQARRVRCSEERLRRALEQGGGALRSFVDQGDYWTTHWTTSTGERHTSAILKSDLTVMSAGVCLDGRDHDFDLQSLVGVVEQGDW